jgi:hypothetical protein
MDSNKAQKLNQLRALSHTLDSKFEGPLGFRFGLDGLLGLIPGIGDLITASLSLYIISQAASLGVGSATLIRMALNVAIENIMDMIPFFGNVFDFYWKSNSKNIILIEKHLAHPARETIKSRMVLAIIILFLLSLIIASAYVTFIIVKSIFAWVLTLNVD